MNRLPCDLPLPELQKKSAEIVKRVLEVAIPNGAGHIAPSLSTRDILVALYYRVMRLFDDPMAGGRDRFVLSKAHGCYALYSILADIGYLRQEDWQTFYKGSFLSGCIERSVEHGIEATCGSLGHGLPIAVGMAYAAKLQHQDYHTYCLVGDGEMQEGSNWEAVQFAVKHELSNLTIIIDANKLQAMDSLENILTVRGREDDLSRKLEAFGVMTKSCDGHSIQDIIESLQSLALEEKRPHSLIAHTIKGQGLQCMEGIPKFHFRLPTKDELEEEFKYVFK